MEAPLEGRLQLVPCDPAAPFLARALLPALHHAVQRQRGLLLLHLPPDVVESTGLAALRDRYSGAPASVGRFRSDQEVQPSAEPAAAAALHTLAGELTKAHMLRMGRRSTALEPFQDDLKQGGAEQHSKLLVSTTTWLDSHMDRGLFNIVVGTAADLAPIWLHVGGGEVAVAGLLPSDADQDELFGLVIPGFTLQLLDPATEAVPHSVRSIAQAGGASSRSSIVLQWRVSPDLVINRARMGDLVEQFESVRLQPGMRAEQAQEEVGGVPPTLPPAEGYVLDVQTLTGRSHRIAAHPQWLTEHLKWAVYQASGTPACRQRLIFSGRQLQDGQALDAARLQAGSLVHLLLNFGGD